MNGKIVLVTGGTNGIGKIAARELAHRGATVVIIGRDPERTRKAAEEIGAQFIVADLSSQADVRRAAAEFKSRFDRLDVLLNNAGAIHDKRTTTADGLETTFAVNHLAYFLLTRELLDVLKRSAPARIVNVASEMSRYPFGRVNLADLNNEKLYWGPKAYARSKRMNLLFTFELARRLEGTGVTVNALHPGAIGSNFATNASWMGWFWKAVRPVLLTPEQGARTSIFLASSPEVERVSGKYFIKSKERRPVRGSLDAVLARKLWEASERLVAGSEPLRASA